MDLQNLLETHNGLVLGLSLLLGLIVGSFLNVVIYRLPRMMERDWHKQAREYMEMSEEPAEEQSPLSLARPASHCPHCGHRIRAYENVPLVSWLLLGGKCSCCANAISIRYPLIELATSVLSAVVVWNLGFDWQAGAALLLTWALIALSMIDYDHHLLPDSITLPFLWLGLVVSLVPLFADVRSAVIGAAAGYLSLWFVYQLFKLVTGKEGMGFGDFKLLALFGAWLGWQALPGVILISSLVGAVVGGILIALKGRDRHHPIPFGPFLAVAGWISLLWGEQIRHAYLNWSGLAG